MKIEVFSVDDDEEDRNYSLLPASSVVSTIPSALCEHSILIVTTILGHSN